MAARKKYRVGKSKIQGDGAFAKKDIMPGEHIGKVHTINQLYTDYDFTELGKKHNHSETPNVQNILVGNERHLIATKPIKKGEELTSNYRLQPDLEQPDEFKSGGTKPHKAQLGTLLKASKAVAPAAKVNRLNHLKELVKMRQEGVDLVNFFENLGWTPEGRQLWNDYLSKGNTVVLTGGRELAPGADAISTGKRAWAKKNLNLEGDKVIVEKQKAKYANPESILIDDLESNVNKFREAGGHAILHTDINNTIKQLQEHMRMNPTHKIFTDLDGVLVDLQGGVEKFRAPKKQNGGWLDKYEEGGVLKQKTHDNYGTKPNANNSEVSLPPGFVGMAYNTKGRNYSPAWGGQFAMGGSLPGAVGFTYARTAGAAPANGPYAKKTKASAQNGQEMKYYQEGLDFKPKTISQDGSKTPGKPKKKTLILAEEPRIDQEGNRTFNPLNPFGKEAENIKKYVNKYFPDEEVEIIPAYKESFKEGLKKSDPNTRLVFLGHYGRNLFGIPSDEVVKTLSKTPYENCYGGTCYGSDLSGIGYANEEAGFGTPLGEYQGLKRAPESYNLRNFNVRTDHVPWLGFSPVERGGEEGFRDSFFRRTQNPELIKAYKSLRNVTSQEEAEKIWKKITKMREAGIDIINKPTAANYSELDVVPFPARTKNYPARPIGLQAGGTISRLSRAARVPLVAGRNAAQTARVLREIRDAGKAIKPNRLLYETVEGSADAAAIKRYQDTKNYIKDLVSKPEVKQAFKDVADIRTKSVPVNQMDPAYTQAITDPDLPLQAVDEIDRSLMTLDPAEVALTKEQSDYVKNLGNLTTDFGLITGSNLQPDDYFRFLMENSDNISPRDIVPLVYSIPNISSQQRSALLQSLATQMPAKASPIARYTAAQDLFALADNYSQLPREIQTVPGGFMSIPQSSYLSNQMRQAFRHLAIDAKTARPTIQIAEPYYTRYAGTAGRVGSANTIIGSLFRSPFRGIPTQAERAASTREISRQIFGRQKSIFSQPKPEDYADLIDYEAALRNYESNKAFTWIGSGSLSADSYEISQRAAKMADKLNLDIIPMHGGSRTSVTPSEANTFAGITKFGQKRGEVQRLLQEAIDKRMLGTLTPEQQRLVSSHRMGLDPSYLHNLMIESRQANALNAELNKILGINLPATTIDPLYNTLQRPLLGYRIKQDGGEIEKAQGGKLIRSALPKAGRAARATAAELRAASNLLREANVADEAASALRQRQAARQAVAERPRATKVVKEAVAEEPKATAASTQKPMYSVSRTSMSEADPESVRAFTESQSKLKDIFSTPEARQAIRDVAESRSASPIAQLDPAYIEAINNPEIATQAIDELAKSLIAIDPATVALNKNQVKYARNLGSFATDLRMLDQSRGIPGSDVAKFVEEFSGDLATTDILPLIKSLQNVSPEEQIALVKRLVDARKQAPLVSSPLAPYTAAQDLLIMAENYRGLPGISPGVDYIGNQAQRALRQLGRSATEVRPLVSINPEYPLQAAGDVNQSAEIFPGLFRSPYTKLPTAEERAAASQQVSGQLLNAKKRYFSVPKRENFISDFEYDLALRDYNATRGKTFIGSESMSADSYDMAQRTALMKDKLNFDLVPMWQSSGLDARPSIANMMGGISHWGSKRGIYAKSMQGDLGRKFLKDIPYDDRVRFNIGRESIDPRTMNNLMIDTRLANATNAELNRMLGTNIPTSVVSPMGQNIERPLIGFLPKQKGGGNVEKGHPVAQNGIRYRRSIDPDVYTSTMTVDGVKFPIKDVYDFYLKQGMVSPEVWRDVMYAEGKLLPEVVLPSTKANPNTLGAYMKEFDTWGGHKNIFPYSVFANKGIISPYSPSANKGIGPMGYQMIMEKQRLENYEKDRLAEEEKKWRGAPGWARSIVGRTAGGWDQRKDATKEQIRKETGPTEDLLQNAAIKVYGDLTDYQATKLLDRSPQGRFQDRRNWIDKSFTPAEQDVLFSSSVLPQPNIYAKTLQGILGAGEGISDFFTGAGSVAGGRLMGSKSEIPYEERMKLPVGHPFRASGLAPGVHPKEADQYNSPFGLMEPFFIPTKMTQGLLNQAGLTDIKTPQGEKYTPLMGLAGWQNDASLAQDLIDPFIVKSLATGALKYGTKGLMKTGAVGARDLVKGRQLLKGVATPPKLVMPKQRSGGKTVNKADEYPIEKLDQSLNFTNYNKPTKGGWLDKYQ